MHENLVMNNDIVICDFCHEELTDGLPDGEDTKIMGVSPEPCSSCGAEFGTPPDLNKSFPLDKGTNQ